MVIPDRVRAVEVLRSQRCYDATLTVDGEASAQYLDQLLDMKDRRFEILSIVPL